MLRLVATCASGLEELLAGELAGLGVEILARDRGGVVFAGGWAECWRANWRLRTANRVLVELASWPAADGEALAAGAAALVRGELALASELDVAAFFRPEHSLAIAATSTGSAIKDTRWAALKTKDGLVDAQRARWGRRADVAREEPDLPLRLRLHRDRATLLLDTSGEPLDRRGYRTTTGEAPLREQLAAACILAAGWDGRGPVVDPMCGTGTLLIEAAGIALGLAPGRLRPRWAFTRFPGFDAAHWDEIRAAPLPAPGPAVTLHGNDDAPAALAVARGSLERAGLAARATLTQGDAFAFQPPPGPGLLAVNPPYGARLEEEAAQWRRLGDLLKQRFRGWRAVVLAGGSTLGKGIGLKPTRRLPAWNGPLEARILVFELY